MNMRRSGKFLFWALAVFLAVFVSLSIFVALRGKPVLEGQMTSALKMPVTVDKVMLTLPLTVELSNLAVGDLAKVKRISFSPNALGLMFGKLVLSGLHITDPVIHLVKSADGSFNIPKFPQGNKSAPLYVTGLTVKNGKIIFTDNHITPQGNTMAADRINMEISKVTFPLTSLRTNYRLSAVFTDSADRQIGSVSGKGWIDFGPKDMDGTFSINNFEATTVAPYYSDFISTKKLTSAKLTMTCLLKAKNNDLAIRTSLKLSDLVYAQEDNQQQAPPTKEDAYLSGLDFFSDRTGTIQYDFTHYTKLDNPSFAPESLRKSIQEAVVNNIVRQSPGDIVEKFNKASETFKAIGKEFKAKWKEQKQQ